MSHPIHSDNHRAVVSFDDPRSRSISEFCEIEGLSLSSFFALKRRGLAPDELRPPGMKIVRITAEAHADWREKIRALAESEDATLHEERRRQFASIAGKRAAKSRAAS